MYKHDIAGSALAGVVGLAAVFASAAAMAEPECPEGDRDLQPIALAQPEYPEIARRYCIEGALEFRARVDTDGRVRDVEITESRPHRFFDETLEVLEEWRFVPACRDGEPIERSMVQAIEFRMEPGQRDHCPQHLEGEARALYSELMVLEVALTLEWMDGKGSAVNLDELMSAEGRFSGELGKVERFQRRWLRSMHEVSVELQRNLEDAGWFRLLDPDRLASDADLAESRLILDRVAARTEQFGHRARQQVDRSTAELESMELDSEVRRQFLSAPDAWAEAQRKGVRSNLEFMHASLERHIAIIDLLAADPDAWRVDDRGRLAFEHQADARRYGELRDALMQAIRDEERQFLAAADAVWKLLREPGRQTGPDSPGD